MSQSQSVASRLTMKALAMVKVVAAMGVVSGVLTSAAIAGKAVSHAYAQAYGGGASVSVRPSEAPTARTMPSPVPSVEKRGDAVPSVARGTAERDVPTYRERRAARALEAWRSARSYERMNVYGLNAGDSERVDAAARELEDATR